MKDMIQRTYYKAGALGTTAAFAATPAFASYDLSGATDGIQTQVTAILVDVLPVAGGIIALTIGWKLLRRMVRG